MDKRAAYAALTAYAKSLPKPPPPGCALPEWLEQPAEPILEHVVRGHQCWVFALKSSQDGVIGYVLDATGNVAYEVRDGNLAAALRQVGRGPRPGLKRSRREWNGRKKK